MAGVSRDGRLLRHPSLGGYGGHRRGAEGLGFGIGDVQTYMHAPGGRDEARVASGSTGE